MGQSVQYWSKEFAAALVAELRRDAGFRKAARKFEDRIELRCLDTPEGKDVSTVYTIRNGAIEVDYTEEQAPSRLRNEAFDDKQCFARTTASYDIWKQVDSGEIGVLAAIRSPAYQVEGSKLAVVKNVGIFRAMNAASGRLQKRY